MAMSMRERICRAILKDLSDRRGIRHALECVDDDVMQEIREALADAVLDELMKPTDGMVEALNMGFYISVSDRTAEEGLNMSASLADAFTAAILAAKEGK
jgi:hypothetical protein